VQDALGLFTVVGRQAIGEFRRTLRTGNLGRVNVGGYRQDGFAFSDQLLGFVRRGSANFF
jgi:hypothetical protein